ncbi:MAG TPA: hypothetical protein VMW20_04305 [Candidatus Nanoarchaeia archaeon]|nr:hypothetical protein [Candidatus Nanoarchaeia archaeon]
MEELKQHKISAELFEDHVFFAHVINGVRVNFTDELSVEFLMTQANRSQSVGDWGGEGVAQVKKTNTKLIKAIMNHPLYTKSKQIRRIPGPAETAYMSNQIKGKEFVKRTSEAIEGGIFPPFDFKSMKKESLQNLANQCGISAFKLDEAFIAGKEKTINELIEELETAFKQEI